MDGWLTTEEAMAVTGLSRGSLYIYRLTGKIRSTTVGRTRLYHEEDCRQLAEERAREQEQEDRS